MVWWFFMAAIGSFIFGFTLSRRWYLSRSLSYFSLFWNYFVQFVKANEDKTVVLNEAFLRFIAEDCIGCIDKHFSVGRKR